MTKYSLDQIKAHPSFPFTDFRTDTLAFLMVELYWAELAREILGSVIESWQPGQEADGKDGNPILHLYDKTTFRSVRVILKFNDENRSPFPSSKGENTYYSFQPWMSVSMTPDGSAELNELVVAADLTEFAESQTRKFFKLHCLDGASVDDMENAIRDYEIEVGMPD